MADILLPILIFLTQANFARAVASLSKAQAKKVARFLPNPERHWGPKLRAGRQIASKHISLLGAEAVNGALSHTDSEEPNAKRPNVEEVALSHTDSEEPNTKRPKLVEEPATDQ